MVSRIAAWEAQDGTVHKTREEADRHDFEQFATPRLHKFKETHFDQPDRRWTAEEVYQLMLQHAEELARCFPPRTTVLTEALAVPSVQRRARDANGHGAPSGLELGDQTH